MDSLMNYVDDVDAAFYTLYAKHNDPGVALNLLSFAVNMRNADAQGRNIGASIKITDETSKEE